MDGPLLAVFGGLPGTGKTTIGRAIALDRQATYLRIDSIEQALRASSTLQGGVGPSGYLVAYALAVENLRLGRMVVADSVNPLALTRQAWRDVAVAASAPILEVEVICSDKAEHRRRIETRASDIPGLVPPGWDEIQRREYDAWDRPRMIIDTALTDVSEAVTRLRSELEIARATGRADVRTEQAP